LKKREEKQTNKKKLSHLSNSGRAADIFSSLHLSPAGKDKALNSF